jgi:hypothetical protein
MSDKPYCEIKFNLDDNLTSKKIVTYFNSNPPTNIEFFSYILNVLNIHIDLSNNIINGNNILFDRSKNNINKIGSYSCKSITNNNNDDNVKNTIKSNIRSLLTQSQITSRLKINSATIS